MIGIICAIIALSAFFGASLMILKMIERTNEIQK